MKSLVVVVVEMRGGHQSEDTTVKPCLLPDLPLQVFWARCLPYLHPLKKDVVGKTKKQCWCLFTNHMTSWRDSKTSSAEHCDWSTRPPWKRVMAEWRNPSEPYRPWSRTYDSLQEMFLNIAGKDWMCEELNSIRILPSKRFLSRMTGAGRPHPTPHPSTPWCSVLCCAPWKGLCLNEQDL